MGWLYCVRSTVAFSMFHFSFYVSSMFMGLLNLQDNMRSSKILICIYVALWYLMWTFGVSFQEK